MRSLLVFILPVFVLLSCDGDIMPAAEQQIVVEGWIEDGGFAVVSLTKTMPLSTEYTDVSDLGDYVVKWAKVEVSDGTRKTILTGMYDSRYFPPYVYKAYELRGEAGKTYHLAVDVEGFHTEATTTIPPRAYVDSITWERAAMDDTLFAVRAHVSRQLPNEYFNFFVLDYPDDGFFLSSFLGAFTHDDLPATGSKVMDVKRGRKYNGYGGEYSPYFNAGDSLKVKIAAMDKAGYSFWSSYERMISLSRNPVFPYSASLPCNLSSGRGYWIGYGSTTYYVIIPE